MGIARFFDQYVVIQRLRTISGNRKAFQSTATVEGHIQSLDSRTRQALGIIEERPWVGYFPVDAPVREGDVVTDEDGVRYEVREVTVKDYHFGINQHTEVVLVEQSV